MYLIGYDIGSSSIKAALVDVEKNITLKVAQHPETEMDIMAQQAGWAEQHPEEWWKNLCLATKKLLVETNVEPSSIKAIGISYQMHGLVVVDKDQKVLRPSIIWCDSRAVEIGNQALADLGKETCFKHSLNGPGNFTASKLKWVKENEPQVFDKIDKFMLPGDYVAMKMTGETQSTMSGLSEGVMWDFMENKPADFLLDYYGIDENKIPEIAPTLSIQGVLTANAANELGLKKGTPVSYRAGDQPNNAMSLGVIEPGEIAATGGTSGVVYGVVDKNIYDTQSRVNTFAHVNHTKSDPRLGVLLCINGAGIQYSWVKQQFASDGMTYDEMEDILSAVNVGSDGLRITPFGNGAERIFGNKNIGSHIFNLHFNRHQKAHFYRASLEGIAFSFVYGIEVLKELGLSVDVIKVGNDNLFRSPVFSNTIAALVNANIEVIETTGAVGAARAAGVGASIYQDLKEATGKLKTIKTYENVGTNASYQDAYQAWLRDVKKLLEDY